MVSFFLKPMVFWRAETNGHEVVDLDAESQEIGDHPTGAPVAGDWQLELHLIWRYLKMGVTG